MSGLARRELLARATWGVAAVGAASGVSMLSAPGVSAANARRTAVFDVACLLDTFTPILAEGATNPDTDFRGTTFFVEGELYRGGAIADGATDFDPASIPPIGH